MKSIKENNQHFKKPQNRVILNRYLYGLMWVENIKIKELADLIGVSRFSVANWIYSGMLPRKHEHIEEVCSILGAPEHIVFNISDIEERKRLLEGN